MTDDRLTDLLREADRSAGQLPADSPDLAGRVRHRARRRRALARAGSGVALALVLAGGAFGILDSRGKGFPQLEVRDPGHNIAASRAGGILAPAVQVAVAPGDSEGDVALLAADEIARLRAEADVSLRVVKKLRAFEDRRRRLDRLEKQLVRPDPFERIEKRIERAALITIQRAERLRRKGDRPAATAGAYRRVMKLFPRTRWAKVAGQRLAEIKNRKGDLL